MSGLNELTQAEIDLRDKIAIEAMKALITGRNWEGLGDANEVVALWARGSYATANAMMKERIK